MGVMTIVVEEDQSRIPWPASPSNGWKSGVDRLSGLPNGKPLQNKPHCILPGASPQSDCPDVKELSSLLSGGQTTSVASLAALISGADLVSLILLSGSTTKSVASFGSTSIKCGPCVPNTP